MRLGVNLRNIVPIEGADGRIMLKWILNEQDLKVRTELNWIRIGPRHYSFQTKIQQNTYISNLI